MYHMGTALITSPCKILKIPVGDDFDEKEGGRETEKQSEILLTAARHINSAQFTCSCVIQRIMQHVYRAVNIHTSI